MQQGAYLPSVAIVIPSFNTEMFISTAIRSALDQNYSNLEVIVVDDGSTDRSVELIKSFNHRVILEQCEHHGGCRARNRGTQLAQAEYVLFLDSDDWLHGDYILQMTQAIEDGTDVVIGAVARQVDGFVTAPFSIADDPDRPCLIAQYLTDFLQTSGFLWRRAFIQAHGGWDETLPISQDVDLALRLLMRASGISHSNLHDAYAVWVQHNAADRITNSMSSKKAGTVLGVLQKHGPALTALGRPDINYALARRFYLHAIVAFATSNVAIGHTALREARQLGLKHVSNGSKVGDLLTKILGIKWKTRLSSLRYNIFGITKPYPYNLKLRK